MSSGSRHSNDAELARGGTRALVVVGLVAAMVVLALVIAYVLFRRSGAATPRGDAFQGEPIRSAASTVDGGPRWISPDGEERRPLTDPEGVRFDARTDSPDATNRGSRSGTSRPTRA